MRRYIWHTHIISCSANKPFSRLESLICCTANIDDTSNNHGTAPQGIVHDARGSPRPDLQLRGGRVCASGSAPCTFRDAGANWRLLGRLACARPNRTGRLPGTDAPSAPTGAGSARAAAKPGQPEASGPTAWTVLSRSASRIVIVIVACGLAIAAPRFEGLNLATMRHLNLGRMRHYYFGPTVFTLHDFDYVNSRVGMRRA